MKDKRGFTLVELIAVISVIAILLVLMIPSVVDIANKSTETTRNSKITALEVAASKYANQDINAFQKCGTITDEKCIITGEFLLNNGYIDDKDSIIDPVTKEKFAGKIYLCFNQYNIEMEAIYDENGSHVCK